MCGFDRILHISEGGFGSVYKAIINDPTATGGDSHYVPLVVADIAQRTQRVFLLWKQMLEIMLRAAQGLAYLHELQALVLLKKGIGDNTHFVTALLRQQVTNSHFPFFMILSREYQKKRLCISGARRTRHHRNHIDVNIFGIVMYKIIAGLHTLK
ncbi:hypothetical protein YC2023_084687 [Brassica napus]